MSGLYVHIPFCVRKCGYCDFYSVKCGKDNHFIAVFMKNIVKEIILKSFLFEKETVETIYFGGGTPSILPFEMIETIFNTISDNYKLSENLECTIEINPEHATEEYFFALKNSGFINRLSAGFQAMDDQGLKYLGRNHSVKDNYRYLNLCEKYGFDNFSVDYIFGYETLTEKEIERSMKFFADKKIPHISAYSLGIEENTIFYKKLLSGKIHKPDDEFFLRQFRLVHSLLESQGYNHYEISNYSLPEKHSRHNSNYWDFVPYLGFGPSAHSYYNNSRTWNSRRLPEYFQQIDGQKHFEENEVLTPTDIFNERIMLGLRTKKGLEISYLKCRFPQFFDSFIKKVRSRELIEYFEFNSDYLKLNLDGVFISDYIISELFE